MWFLLIHCCAIFLCHLGRGHHGNPNSNDRDHLVGQLTLGFCFALQESEIRPWTIVKENLTSDTFLVSTHMHSSEVLKISGPLNVYHTHRRMHSTIKCTTPPDVHKHSPSHFHTHAHTLHTHTCVQNTLHVYAVCIRCSIRCIHI